MLYFNSLLRVKIRINPHKFIERKIKARSNNAKLEGFALCERLLLTIIGIHNLRYTLTATSIDISHIKYRHVKMANVDR